MVLKQAHSIREASVHLHTSARLLSNEKYRSSCAINGFNIAHVMCMFIEAQLSFAAQARIQGYIGGLA
jgi:hypothetical protein